MLKINYPTKSRSESAMVTINKAGVMYVNKAAASLLTGPCLLGNDEKDLYLVLIENGRKPLHKKSEASQYNLGCPVDTFKEAGLDISGAMWSFRFDCESAVVEKDGHMCLRIFNPVKKSKKL